MFSKKEIGIQSLAYTSLVHPILQYRSACWFPRQEEQINVLDQVQKKATQFTNHMNDPDWETLAQSRMIAHLCTLFKVYTGERVWKAIHDRLRRPYYLSRVDHVRKIRDRKHRMDIGKYSL